MGKLKGERVRQIFRVWTNSGVSGVASNVSPVKRLFKGTMACDEIVSDAHIKAEKFAQRNIFKKVKDEEYTRAISLFEDVVRMNDAIEDGATRVENLVRGIFAGNIFDLGSAQLAELFSKDGMSFLASCQNLVPRPWVIDDLDAFIQ
ncbi:Damage-control phosphatase [Camellia lanceoleosa]|uniref:Damage-control phosphatase n=1 Tax=Camellia lanceoleosa TaxID=1840588 RepID=A0ACC0HH06_9ERIC|nr:Damage-control phosphatase [Camellia lanceoleosa]